MKKTAPQGAVVSKVKRKISSILLPYVRLIAQVVWSRPLQSERMSSKVYHAKKYYTRKCCCR